MGTAEEKDLMYELAKALNVPVHHFEEDAGYMDYINPHKILKFINQFKSDEYWKGFDYACKLLDETYAKTHPHEFNIADCLKAKVNRLPKNKIRENSNQEPDDN